jgi:hypothetical protein
MPATALTDLTTTLTQRSAITAEDVLALRRLVWGDGAVNREEAEAIMALNTACRVRAPEWIDYFVEVMVDYVVHQQKPEGYVDQGNADWLMRWIDRDGRVDSLGELELLVKVLETAQSVPDSLRDYALKQVEAAVLNGDGPTRRTGLAVQDGGLDASGINATEVELLRRVVYAQAGDANIIVSQAEADMLFRLKDATLNKTNAPQWADLFVKCVGNHLMGHSTYQPLTRDEQASFDAYIADTHVNLSRFVNRAFAAPALVQKAFGKRVSSAELTQLIDGRVSPKVLDSESRVYDKAAAAVDLAITPDEKTWLTARIQADGATDALETALLNFIRRESGPVRL